MKEIKKDNQIALSASTKTLIQDLRQIIDQAKSHVAATGKSRPSAKTVQRIQEGILRFSEELHRICLI